MDKINDYDQFLKLATDWLVHTDVRNNVSNHVGYGGFNLGYDLKKKSYPLVYCEITGYALNIFVDLYRWEQTQKFLDVAKNAAEFLISMQDKQDNSETHGAFPRGYSLSQKTIVNDYYAFDAAICMSGLIDLYNETNEQAFLDSAKIAGNWLLRNMIYDDGSFRALYNSDEMKYVQKKKWFGDRGCLHAKNAIGLLKLYDVTMLDQFKESAKNVCDWVLNLQQRNGVFVAAEGESYTFTHAHCYATEGILYAYSELEDKKYLDAVLKSGRWLIKAQNKDGSLNRYYNKLFSIPIKTTDATAQALRIWIILYQLTSEKDFLDAAFKSAEFLMHMQCLKKGDPNALGGVFYQSREFWKLRYTYPYITTWSTMFAVHAIHPLQDLDNKKYKTLRVF